MTRRRTLALALSLLAPAPLAADPDADGDGVPDATDACPDRAETLSRFATLDGCPDAATVPAGSGNKRGANDPSLLLGVLYFSASSTELAGPDLEVLTRAAKRLQASPGGGTVALVGHADAGEGADAIRLSNERCQAVRGALAAAGIPTSRLGFCYAMGARVPAVDGAPERNRRVELTVKQSAFGAYSTSLDGGE